MDEYIEREKVLTLINGFKRNDVTPHCVDYPAGWNEALEQIESNIAEDIPAADVRPERHGKWVVGEFNGIGTPIWCGRCGYRISNLRDPKSWIAHSGSQYCGCCGAKMDGKDGENNGV